MKDIKLSSIISKKKKDIHNYTFNLSENKKIKDNSNNNEKFNKYHFGRLPSANIINLNMQVLTNNKMNFTFRDPFFQKKVQEFMRIPKETENKKEKIDEILKESDKSLDNSKQRISVFKRDDYYKKNLTRIKFFYGFDKK